MKQSVLSLLLACLLLSCNSEKSLQKYYVENQDNQEFLALDLPISTFIASNSSLDPEQRETLATIRKVNLLAFPLKDGQSESFENEKSEIETILQSEKYESLMRFGRSGQGAHFYLVGDEDAIDEFVIYGSDENRGFMVARVLGDNMKVDELYHLVETMEPEDFSDIPALKNFLEATFASPNQNRTHVNDTVR